MPKMQKPKPQPDFKATIPSTPITNNQQTSDASQNAKQKFTKMEPNHKNGDFTN